MCKGVYLIGLFGVVMLVFRLNRLFWMMVSWDCILFLVSIVVMLIRLLFLLILLIVVISVDVFDM